jgi:hypothetical protein
MNSSTILNSIAVVTLALTLSACGRKSDVKTEAAKPENPLAMKDASAPTQAPSGDAAAAANSTESDAKSVVSAGANNLAPGAIAAPNAQQLPGLAFEQRNALSQANPSIAANPSAAANPSKRTPSRIRLKNGHEAVSDGE